MHIHPARAAAALSAALFATVPAVANAATSQFSTSPLTRDVLPTVLWMLAAVAVFALVLGTLYLFKRRVGGFPRNPTWVPPISIMRSADLPGDRDPHEATPPSDPHMERPLQGH
jgi:hypothetical protein